MLRRLHRTADAHRPGWPEWCWVPSLVATVETARLFSPQVHDALMLLIERGENPADPALRAGIDAMQRTAWTATVASAWRETKGVYVFDPTFVEEMARTPLDMDVPGDALRHLPDWCPYLAFPEPVDGYAGVYAMMDIDSAHGSGRLMLMWVAADQSDPAVESFYGTPLDMSKGSLAEAVSSGQEGFLEAHEILGADPRSGPWQHVPLAVGLLLYLVSDRPDVTGRTFPDGVPPSPGRYRPAPKRAKGVPWQVGWRVGAAIRAADRKAASEGGEPTGRTVRPHVRRAHWHTYWTGPRGGERTPVVRWLSPVAVNTEVPERLPAVVHA